MFNFVKPVFAKPKLTGLTTTVSYLQDQEVLLLHVNTVGTGFIRVARQCRFIFGKAAKIILIPNDETDFIVCGFFYKKIHRISRKVKSFHSRRTKPNVIGIKRFSIKTNTIKRIELNSAKLVSSHFSILHNNIKVKKFNIKSI